MSADSQPGGQTTKVTFEGREIRCRSGVSLAAALTEAGELILREAGDGDPRGLYCGMGVCQECRLSVNGRHGTRACMTVVTESLQVTRQAGNPPPESSSGSVVGAGDYEVVEPDVLVIGAGAGGLTAASVAAEAGAEVVVIDERPKAGGQFFKQPLSFDDVPRSLSKDRQFADGKALIERAERCGVKFQFGTEVWGAFAPNDFAVFDGDCSRVYRPKKTVVATGAHERGLPLPGWTLPGVMTTGAAQILLRSYGSLPGERVLVAGNGPLNLQVALELKRAGVDVVAVVELAPSPGPSSLLDGVRMFLNAPGVTSIGARCLTGLKASRVPVLYRRVLTSVEKHDGALRARIGQVGRNGIDADRSFDADVVCVGYGFQPNNEILRNLGCRHGYDDNRGQLVADRNAEFETSVESIYAVGDCCGLGGAPAACAEGAIAGSAVARSLGLVPASRLVQQEKLAIKRLRRHRAFQAALWRIFSAPRFQAELASPDTLICRCEKVSLQEFEEALADGDPSMGTIKRRTRLGMGACQGRYCAPVAAAMIAKRDGCPVDEFSFFAPRSPLKPIRIADMLKATVD